MTVRTAPSGCAGRSSEEARRHRWLHEPSQTYVTDFFGSQADASPGPQAFLVEVPGDYSATAHFHGVNQFQLFVAGAGMFGRKPVGPGSVHYADAYTTYGPIETAEEGLVWFTLRQTAYVGLHEMPGSRDVLEGHRPGRYHRVESACVKSRPGMHAILTEGDGLSVCDLVAPAGGPLPRPAGSGRHGGAYCVVLHGDVTAGGDTFPTLSCFYVAPGHELAELTAGARGASAVFLAFGRAENP